MKKPLNTFIQDHRPVYFVSPHLDDAVFSAGGLISHLVKHQSVKVINVFTDASVGKSTLSGRTFLRQCGYTDAGKLYSDRRHEDSQVFSLLNLKPLNLNLPEALWRFKGSELRKLLPELDAVYPTYRWHITTGKLAASDRQNLQTVTHRLSTLIPKNAVVLAPVGIGGHVDHVLVREAVAALPNPKLYWADYPYHTVLGLTSDFVTDHKLVAHRYEYDTEFKSGLMAGYVSQFAAVFPQGVKNLPPEIYFSKNFKS